MATFAQVIQDHTKKFMQEMNAKEIARKLKELEVIPESVEYDILQSKDKDSANICLLRHLKDNADEEAVMEVFRIASEMTSHGFGRMNTFATDILRKLRGEPSLRKRSPEGAMQDQLPAKRVDTLTGSERNIEAVGVSSSASVVSGGAVAAERGPLVCEGGQDGTTIQPRFAILTANDNEKRAVMHFLRLGEQHNWLNAKKFPKASGCSHKADAFLQNKKALVEGNERTLDYSTFTIEVSGKKIAGVHVHCDSYGPWGAFEKTVQLLTDVKSKGWPLKTIFVVGCCGASMSEQMKKKETWCGTVLLAEGVNSYLHTGKAEAGTDANGTEPQVIVKGKAKHREIETKWLVPLESVVDPKINIDYGIIKVRRAVYLSGPLVIKNQLFGDNCRGGEDIAGVEMEVIGVIQAVDAIHDYSGISKDKRPGIVLAKGISDCTQGKEKKAKCVFFDQVTEKIDDDSRQMYATLQSIALVIRCVANNIQVFC